MTEFFWYNLSQPFFVLAPMHGVTDAAFRQIIIRCGKPDVTFTEFVSADGLCSSGKEKLLPILKYSENERPIVAQIFGADPKKFFEAAKIIKNLGFDGIDINMGCPDKTIMKQGAGAALIGNFKLAQEIIEAAKEGAGNVPISVKTRIGNKKAEEYREWIAAILGIGVDALTVHVRTAKEMYAPVMHWDVMTEISQMAHEKNAIIIGNGGINNIAEGKLQAEKYNLDGIMIGRAAISNPWVFSGRENISSRERIDLLLEHIKLFEETYAGERPFVEIKKYIAGYISGFSGAKELRVKLMEAKSLENIKDIAKHSSV